MANVKIIYESKYGQTQKIAEHTAAFVRKRSHTVDVRGVDDADLDRLGAADAYVVFAPVYLAKHPKAITRFIERNATVLGSRPSAFVSVSGAAGSPRPGDREEARKNALQFIATTSWQPNLVATAGGAIAYPRYDFFTRIVMKAITRKNGGPTDTSKIHELTDWDAVDRVTLELLALLPNRPQSGHLVV